MVDLTGKEVPVLHHLGRRGTAIIRHPDAINASHGLPLKDALWKLARTPPHSLGRHQLSNTRHPASDPQLPRFTSHLLQQQSERSQTAGPSLHSSPHAEALEAVPSVRLEPQAGRDQQLRHAGRQPERCRRC
eukprot:scaffold489_cov259-Pinguiococcus_pyrenoidosus.AAC.27